MRQWRPHLSLPVHGRLRPSVPSDNDSEIPAVMTPRFSLATLMSIVMVAAVNFAAGDHAFFGLRETQWPDLVQGGVRPMASVLGIGFLPLLAARSPRVRSRPFLAAFEIVGILGVLTYLACAAVFTREIHELVFDNLKGFVSPGSTIFPWSILLIFLAPQLLIAAVGGWLNARYQGRRAAHVDPAPAPSLAGGV